MKVLHICNDFNYQKLYINLFRENAKSIDQVVYCGNRNKEITGNNVDSTVSNIEYFNPYIVYPFDKINYFGKALRQFNFIKKNIKLSEIDHIHAHTFFSDGIIALLINYYFKISFTVSVRNTDVNAFFKYKPYLIPLGKLIYNCAKTTHFPAQSIKAKFFSKIPRPKSKSIIIPNPLDDYWLKNQQLEKKRYEPQTDFKICFVGKIDANKNIEPLVKAVGEILPKHNIKLTIVGRFYSKSIKKRVLKNTFVKHIKHTETKQTLLKIYRDSHLLCLPSKKETFGLVCLESLTQGTPFLMRKGQGLHGLIEETKDSFYFESDSEISLKIQQVINEQQPNGVVSVELDKFKCFDISKKFISIYKY